MPAPRLIVPPRRRRPVDFSLAIVNIVLLLVFFFLISGTLVRREEQAVLPAETANLPLDRLPRPLLVLDGAETWALDGTPLDPAGLAAALGNPAPDVLYLLPAAGLPADALLRLMARPELAQTSVRLVTLHVRREPPP